LSDSPTDESRLQTLIRWFETEIPFNLFLGLKVVRYEKGECTLRIPWRDELVGDASRPAIHGGVISMLADTCGGAACFSMLDNPADRVSTVDLRVDYLRPGPRADLLCDAHVVRMGNKVAVARMEVYADQGNLDEARKNPVATGQAVYNVVRR
jgi:uncharacterized protein (TIGR00369 family)